MRILEDYTDIRVSNLTNPARLAVGCCIILLVPLLNLSSIM